MIQDIIDAITTFFSDLVGSLLDFILNLLISAIQLLFFPIDALFSTFFNDFSSSLESAVTNINNFINNIATMPLSWFINLLPSMTRTALLLYITFLLSYYVFAFGYRTIKVAINLFHKIKFW